METRAAVGSKSMHARYSVIVIPCSLFIIKMATQKRNTKSETLIKDMMD